MRKAGFVLLAIGLCAAVVSFFGLSAESLPYQDPTPEMRSAQARSIHLWQSCLLAGVATSAAAGAVLWRTRRRAGGSQDTFAGARPG